MTDRCVVFSTPGLIPMESFQTFGINAKPNSTNPFGFFGTGLKIAIAVCLRMGQEVVLWRGEEKYTFYVSDEDFRGKQFGYVRMKREKFSLVGAILGRPQYTKLPFTTELGKTWELWQAFREFETNTRDENGDTHLTEVGPDSIVGQPDCTTILVFGSRFIDEFHDMDRNFLPDGKIVREDEAIQVIDRPSKHIYYRGVRVVDLREETVYTYNFLKHVELTEDRTAKHPFILEGEIADLIISSEDRRFVGRTVGRRSRGYERNLWGYGYSSRTPSEAFVTVARESTSPAVREVAEKAKKASAPKAQVHLRITVPRSSVTDEEIIKVQQAVAEALGFSTVEDLKVEDMDKAEENIYG